MNFLLKIYKTLLVLSIPTFLVSVPLAINCNIDLPLIIASFLLLTVPLGGMCMMLHVALLEIWEVPPKPDTTDWRFSGD